MKNSRSIYEKIDGIPGSWIRYFAYIIVVIVILNPIGLPIAISKEVSDFSDAIESLPAGSIVLISNGDSLSGWATRYPAYIALFNHLFKNNIKPIIWCYTIEGTLVQLEIIKAVNPEGKYGAIYGEDWAFFGYTAGQEAAFRSVASNFRDTYSIDYYGNSIDDLTVMDGIDNIEDMAPLIISFSTSMEAIGWHVRQFNLPYGKKIITISSGTDIGAILPYYPQIILGYLAAGAQSAAEYEILIKMPGAGATFTDSMSLLTIYLFLILIITNIVGRGLKSGLRVKKEGLR